MEQVRGSAILRWAGMLARRNVAMLPGITIFLCLCFQCPALVADEPLEYQVKAAFLLNFTKFVEWPPTAFGNAGAPVAICILGANPFGSALDQIVRDEVVSGRRVTVQYIRQAPAPQTCQVLFLNGWGKETRTLPPLGPGVLTVGEGEGFIRDGGMIAFVLEKNRVRFEINENAAERAGLRLSSRLLNVARSVER